MLRNRPLAASIDAACRGVSPSQMFFAGVTTAIVTQFLIRLLSPGQLFKRLNALKNSIIRTVFAGIVKKEVEKAAKEFSFKQLPGEAFHDELPAQGLSSTEVLALATHLHDTLDCRYDTGCLSGTVYHGGAEHTKLVNDMMCMFQWSNPLHLDVFNAVRKMEAEVVEMVVRLFHGHSHRPDACGALTSGGTESIAMAVKTYRDWGRQVKGIGKGAIGLRSVIGSVLGDGPGVAGGTPNIVMPVTAHPAFDKACRYYGLDLIKVPVDSKTGAVDPNLLEKYINCNTVAIVGSAPNFPYGTVDPIAALGQIAIRHGIGLHVDACLGGFVIQFLAAVNPMWEMGKKVDFRVPGVTTISCDTHKFGFAPKGTSVIMYASKALRAYQYFALAEWPGGLYASPGACGSKAGNVIAGTWAALMSMGKDGYAASTKRIVETVWEMRNGISEIPGLRILGNPTICAVSFTSDDICIYTLSSRLTKKYGWKLNPLQFPAGIQFSLTLVHTRDGIMKRFLGDVRQEVAAMQAERDALIAAKQPVPAIGTKGGTMYGSQQRVSDRSIIEMVTHAFLDGYHETHHEPTPAAADASSSS